MLLKIIFRRYYMYGQHTGVLAVATAVGNTSTIVWLKAGQQGAQWNQGQVRIPRQDTPFKVRTTLPKLVVRRLQRRQLTCYMTP